MHPAEIQISLGICPVWSESSLCTEWVVKDPSFLHADREDWADPADLPAIIQVGLLAGLEQINVFSMVHLLGLCKEIVDSHRYSLAPYILLVH